LQASLTYCWRIYNASASFSPLLTSTVCNYTGSSPRIPPFGLAVNTRFAVQLVLNPGSARQAHSAFFFIVTSAPPAHPNPVVFIDNENPLVVNNGSSLRLAGRATSAFSNAAFTFTWTEISSAQLNLDNNLYRASTIGSANLVMRSGAFLADFTYRWVILFSLLPSFLCFVFSPLDIFLTVLSLFLLLFLFNLLLTLSFFFFAASA
jgi:hypothetical protein